MALEEQSRLPPSVILQQSPAPTATPIPRRARPATPPALLPTECTPDPSASPPPSPPPPDSSSARPPPKKRPTGLQPKLLLEVRDLRHQGSLQFLQAINAAHELDLAVRVLRRLLYSSDADVPPTRSVTLVVRPMPGVAYTTGKDLDSDHKEIHLSADYVAQIPEGRCAVEIRGVIQHEMIHCFQWNANGSAPGGLIEGIADWVRLRAGLAPPHWTRTADGSWDSGYQHTAYFLDYLEGRFGKGTVEGINLGLRNVSYHEKSFWHSRFAQTVEQLWADYAKWLARDQRDEVDDEAVVVDLREVMEDERQGEVDIQAA